MEKLVVEFAQKLLRLYFEERNLNAVVSYLDPAVTWIGFGKNEICTSYKNAVKALQEEERLFHGSFTIRKSHLFAENNNNGIFTVYGSLTIRENSLEQDTADIDVRLTAVCRASANGMKLCHVHISQLSEDQREDQFFPVLFSNQTGYLKKMLDEKTSALKARNADLQAVTNNIPGGVFRCLFDEKLTLLYVSDGFISMFGYTREEIKEKFGNSFWEMIYPEDWEAALASAQKQMEAGNTKELEYRIIRKDGTVLHVLDKGQRIVNDCGEESFYCILIDMTSQKKGQEELRLSLERHKIIMDQTTDIIFEWDILNDSLIFSSNWEKKFGYSPIDKQISTRISFSARIHEDDRSAFTKIMETVKDGTPYTEAEFRIQNADGRFIWCRIRATTQYNQEGVPVKAVGVIVDIDNEKKSRQVLLYKAERDSLTGLYNKMTAQNEVERFIDDSDESGLSALMIIDIDNFKMFNDTLGHLFGDAVLSHISNEMKKQFRSSDIIGRLGGDEFIVFLKNIPNTEFAEQKAEQLIKIFNTLFADEKKDYQITCSVGISVYPQDGKSFNRLYHNADLALYKAKSKGKNRCVRFDQKLEEEEVFSMVPQPHSNTLIDSDQNAKLLSDRLIEYVFGILYKSDDLETAVSLTLELIGKQFNVSRAYIFENTEDDLYCNNTFEWCNTGITPEIDQLQNISYEKDLGGNFHENFNENGIFYCRDIAELPESQYRILAPQGIKSMLQCAIRDKGVFKGYVGFDECSAHRFWTKEQIDILSMLARILSTFLLKQRSQERLIRTVGQMEMLLEQQNSLIYTVDKNYILLYANHKTWELVPSAQIGVATCYKIFFGRGTPCEICPIQSLKKGDTSNSMEIYNACLDIWTLTDASSLTWDGKDAYLLTCHDISKYKRCLKNRR